MTDKQASDFPSACSVASFDIAADGLPWSFDGDGATLKLALVSVDGDRTDIRYLQTPFRSESDFGVTSVNYDWDDLWGRGVAIARAKEEVL